MAKGYWIPHIDVSNPEGYKAYMAATPAAHDKYGGRALVRGKTPKTRRSSPGLRRAVDLARNDIEPQLPVLGDVYP